MLPTELTEVHPGFFVSRAGEVFYDLSDGTRLPRNVFFTDGYPMVSVKINKRWGPRPVHLLVMAAFGPPKPSPSHIVRHKNGDPSNPHIDNLLWGTQKNNRDDDTRHGKTNAFRKAADRTRAVQVFFRQDELRAVILAAEGAGVPIATFIKNCVTARMTAIPSEE